MLYKIYKYTNIHNGKVYIGQTRKTLAERSLYNGNNYKECRRFYNAIKKYGWNSFIPEIIEDGLSRDEANNKEIYYIEEYESTNPDKGYNIAYGGCNSVLSPESAKIISDKAKQRYKIKENNPMFGKHHTKESIQKMSNAKIGCKNPMFGKKWTETQKIKCGTKGKKLNLSNEQRDKLSKRGKVLGELRKKKTYCIEDDKTFDSLTEAANYYEVNVATLCAQLNGRQKTCRGKHFIYIK